ncbi:MAG: hypothetical protein ACXVAG_19050 [Vulcanimicrobiaceae bacterium]
MSDSQTPTGKTLAQADPRLFEEMMRLLESGDISLAAYQPTDGDLAAIRAQLPRAVIRERCACSEPECATYRFEEPEKQDHVSYRTIRFHVRGEALLHFDDEGDVYSVERLYEPADAKPKTRYERQPDDTWKVIRLE